MTDREAFEAWRSTLTTDQRYDFDSSGRGFLKSQSLMMEKTWQAAIAYERSKAQQERKPEDSAETWHRRYMEATQQHNDRVAVLGGEIEALEADLQSYQGAWPAWHDAPDCAGLWIHSTTGICLIEGYMLTGKWEARVGRWYGPIPEDKP